MKTLISGRRRVVAIALFGAGCVLALPHAAAQSRGDAYAGMLSYLSADSRIDGNALSGANGAIAVNQAAGDLNLQANLFSLANGGRASANVSASQRRQADTFNSPMQANALIGGNALVGASGIASINQASGGGNTELNAVTATLATQGIREASDEAMASSAAFASAGGQPAVSDPRATRRVGVEASALRGFDGVLQLNQIAGSSNATENRLSISVQGNP
ncbi:hypothetical protein [Stenotrophomonas sp. SY1]|uniref:hypothetical protein n=1 Tax=Stenotrophomonas sp. SY1 TaxID=477235 RepID=UPI001E5C2F7A|nr:hypothetical protein [Stenotrophomonas sp. SY1]MCD9086536.1 hypothetical protein [Stenotrophomonas sp. SY1]